MVCKVVVNPTTSSVGHLYDFHNTKYYSIPFAPFHRSQARPGRLTGEVMVESESALFSA